MIVWYYKILLLNYYVTLEILSKPLNLSFLIYKWR